LAYDFVSSDCTLADAVGSDPEIWLANASAYPAASSAPKIDCMIAPPKSRWRSAVPDAMPARHTGTEPVSEWEAGAPAKPTPVPTSAYASPTFQYGMPSFHSRSIARKPSRQNTYPHSSVNRAPCDSTSFADRGATSTMRKAAGRIDVPASTVE